MIRYVRDGTASGEMWLVMDWELLGADMVSKGKAGICSNGPHAGEILPSFSHRDTWQCPQTFLIVKTRDGVLLARRGYRWHI